MDQVGNFLTSIRNAELAGHTSVDVRYATLHTRLLDILQKHGFVSSYTEVTEGPRRSLRVKLPAPVTRHHYKRLSTPGRRLYVGADKIPLVLRGLGIVVLSTPKGVMTGKEARKQNVGGELIFEAY